MNLKELAFPIRIYWDLTPEPENGSVNHESICSQIVEMKLFTLNLLDTGPQLSSHCINILKQLKNEMISVSLTVSQSVLNPSTVELLSGLKVNELLVEATSDDEFRLIAESIRQYKENDMTIGASIQINENNYREIPHIVSYCLTNDITRLVFPMQRVTAKSKCFYISREEGEALTHGLSDIDIDKIKITIHDPFLWRIFYSAVSFPGGGCQAANSMAFISPDGKVCPCPTMPIELGDLKETPLKTILSSDTKKELQKNLRNAPEECLGCNEISGCMGGCSGRVFALNGSLDQRDPACM
jgi:GeoRSP system SPASM domain protein